MVHNGFNFDSIQHKAVATYVRAKVFHLHDPLVFCKVDVCLKIDEIEKVEFQDSHAGEPGRRFEAFLRRETVNDI